MDWITEGIAIGSVREASDTDLLAAEGVGAVLRLLDDELKVGAPEMHQLWLRVADGQPLDVALLRRGVEFIREQRAVERRLLVHCGLGQSRSPTFVAAYLHEEGHRLLDALLLIQQIRPIALPHPVLLRSLVQVYRLPDDPGSLLAQLVSVRKNVTGSREIGLSSEAERHPNSPSITEAWTSSRGWFR